MKVNLKKEDVDKIRELRWRCRTDLQFFCNHVLGYKWINRHTHGPILDRLQQFPKPNDIQFVENDRYDPKLKTWVYRPICRHQDLEGPRHMLLLDPRGHAKTTLGVISHILQHVINHPNITCLVIVANEDRAATIVSEIAEHFKTNEVFRSIFADHVPTFEQAKNFGNMSGFTTLARDFSYEDSKVKRETTVFVGSIDAGVASRHFDILKASDIVDDKNSETSDQCQKIVNRFSLLGPVIVNERSWVYVEGTRYHQNDLYGQLIEADNQRRYRGESPKYNIFFRSCFERVDPTFSFDDITKPFKLDERGKRIPVFPFDSKTGGGFSIEKLESMQNDPIDSLNFNCQYLNDPTPVEGSPLPVDAEHPDLIDPNLYYDRIKVGYRDMAVDFAYTQGARSDNTAISVMAWDFSNRPFIEDIQVGKFTIEESVAHLARMYDKYRPLSLYIEDTPFTRGLEPTLYKYFQAKKLYPNWVWIRRPGNVKKTHRIEASLSVWWKNKALRFVHDPSGKSTKGISKEAMQILKKEASGFPRSIHDDILDTLADLFKDKEYFGRLGPRDIQDPKLAMSLYEQWKNSPEGTRQVNDFIYGPQSVLPDFASNKFGLP